MKHTLRFGNGHLNRGLKGIIRNMGANVVPSALARAANQSEL